LRKHAAKGDFLFYVIAELERRDGTRHFKTIAPRSEIPVSFRRL
jgi:hypothetical protein